MAANWRKTREFAKAKALAAAEERRLAPLDMKARLRVVVQEAAARQGAGTEVCVGIMDGSYQTLRERDFVYCDHAYFQRGWKLGNFRAVRRGLHLTKIIPRPADRLKRWGVRIQPWRRGRNVIVIDSSSWLKRIYSLKGWPEATTELLRKHTDRPIIVKHKGEGELEPLLQDAWAVVCFASVAGVEAALYGVPVFTSPACPAWPVNAGRLEDIEKPERPERHEWACSLSYATWNTSELDTIGWRDYQYELCEH